MKKFFTFLIITIGVLAAQAQRTVTGSIADKSGNALIGVTVVAKDLPDVGAITDIDGNFSLSVPEGTKFLTVNYTGYQSQDVAIDGSNNVKIEMDIAEILDELLVVGYGSKSSRNNTQSVAVLSERALKNRIALGPQELLQGQAAGVQMVNSSGLLGAQASIRIRGAASITGGGQPLFVVDGVPLNDDVRSTAQGGGTGLNPLININSSDIESMTVLKDAAAVAIYGSRGSNGVVIIKTKKGGNNEKTSLSLDVSTGKSDPTNLLQTMNAQQYADYNNEYRKARGLSVNQFPTTGFDWVKSVVQTGKNNVINLSARGGSEKTSYYLGGSFSRESGFTIGNDSERLSGRLNVEHKAKDWLTLGSNISTSKVTMDRVGAENNTFAPLTSSYLQQPYVVPRDTAGNLLNTGFVQNVIAIEQLNTNDLLSRRTVGNVFVDFKIIDGLNFRSDFGMDNSNLLQKTRVVNLITPGGTASRNVTDDYKWLTTNTLNFRRDIGDGTLGLLAGYSFETSKLLDVFVAGSGFASDDLPNVTSASTPTSTNEDASEWALESQFARADYNYKNTYIIEGTFRRDGSSRFGVNNRYGNFYAVSGGIILSELFFKNNNTVNLLKLTGSYGTAGNDRIGNFSSLALYGGGVASDYAGAAGLRPTQTPNPDLTWETTGQLDFGIASKFFDSRLIFNVNWYDKKTTGALLNVPQPWTTGFTSVSRNIGEVQNTGIDLDISGDVITTKDFNLSLNFNGGYLKNKVIDLPNAAVDPDGNKFITGSANQRAVAGRTLNEFFMVRGNGVNPQTGDYEWLDKTGKPVTTYSTNDRVFVGSAIPKYVGGFGANIGYKGIELSGLFNFTYGNKVLIDGLRFTENMSSTAGFNKTLNVLNYWKESGDVVAFPKLSSSTAPLYNQASTNFLQNGSFLRLRNLQVGYSLPESIIRGQKAISSARIYFQGQNLWLMKDKNFRGPDPEVSANGANNLVQGESFFALPQAKIMTVGANITF
jgi:TonB-dependent starch-binding outer membrane protein SusC